MTRLSNASDQGNTVVSENVEVDQVEVQTFWLYIAVNARERCRDVSRSLQ